MDSADFRQTPDQVLKKQALHRSQIIILIICVWGGLLGVLRMPVFKPQQNIHEAWVRDAKALCAAKVLSDIFSHAIKGVHLSQLSFSDQWKIVGVLDAPDKIDELKSKMSGFVNHPSWKEEINGSRLHFQLQGQLAC
jgi:hypothetical protein